MAVALRVAGTRVDGTTGSLTPSHPAGIQENDIVLLHAFFHEGTTTTTGTWNTPTGFTLVRKQNLTVAGAKKGELALFWKRAVGGESGTVTVSRTGGTGNATVSTANMSVWSGCVTSGDPWEGLTGITDETPPYAMSVTTTAGGRVVVAWVFANDNVASTGQDANWTNVVAPYTDATGIDYAGHVASRVAGSAAAYAGSWSQSSGIEGVAIGLALIELAAQNLQRVASDTITSASDSVVSVIINIRSLVDTITSNDSVVRSVSAIRSLIDTTSISDSISRISNKIRTVVDTITVITDSVAGTVIRILFRNASDTITTVTDNVIRIVTEARIAVDTISVSDSVGRVANQLRGAVDTIVTSDAVIRISNKVRFISDVTSVSDSVSRAAILFVRVIADTITVVTDSLIRAVNIVRTAADTVITLDSISRTLQVARNVIDTLSAITDFVTSSAALIVYRTVSDTLTTATDVVNRTINITRTIVDVVSISDSVSRVATYVRQVQDFAGVLGDSVVRGGIIVYRNVIDNIPTVTDFVSFIKGIPAYTGEYVRIFARNWFGVGTNEATFRARRSDNAMRAGDSNNKEQVR